MPVRWENEPNWFEEVPWERIDTCWSLRLLVAISQFRVRGSMTKQERKEKKFFEGEVILEIKSKLHRGGNWGSERVNDLSNLTQLVSDVILWIYILTD